MNSPLADLKIEQMPPTLRDLVQDRMRAAIIAGRFASGERLVERTLCEQLGVSRTVVREVIRYLEAEGLVEILAGKGPAVARLDWDQARQIYDIRLLLEQSAARSCALRADAGVKAGLQAALSGIGAAFAAGETQGGLLVATQGFYQVIFHAAGQHIAWDIVQRLNGRISRLRALTLATKERNVSGQARMARICAAITANDPEAAARAVHDHLTEAAGLARALLEGKQGGV